MSKTWFAIDGSLEPLAFDGPSFFRFPLELAERVITTYSAPGDWVLDPFCGFGTTLVAAQRLGRQAIGFERDPGRGRFAGTRVQPPSCVVVDDARHVARYALPRFDLLFSSPPYTSFSRTRSCAATRAPSRPGQASATATCWCSHGSRPGHVGGDLGGEQR